MKCLISCGHKCISHPSFRLQWALDILFATSPNSADIKSQGSRAHLFLRAALGVGVWCPCDLHSHLCWVQHGQGNEEMPMQVILGGDPGHQPIMGQECYRDWGRSHSDRWSCLERGLHGGPRGGEKAPFSRWNKSCWKRTPFVQGLCWAAQLGWFQKKKYTEPGIAWRATG